MTKDETSLQMELPLPTILFHFNLLVNKHFMRKEDIVKKTLRVLQLEFRLRFNKQFLQLALIYC